MSSSSSSSSSSQVKKKKEKKSKKKDKKKDKKSDKKDKKAEKKTDKKAKKEAKRLERTADWDFDRSEVNRLVAQLLQLDEDIADELRAVFQQIDGGDVVRIDGLDNKSARKKLRHLFQSFGLIVAGEQGFRTPTKKVSFVQLFEESLKKAKGSGKATSTSAAPSQDDAGAKKRASLEAKYQPMEVDEAAAPAAEAEPPSEFLAFGETEAPASAPAPQKKVVGPKLPGADLGPAGGEDSEDEGPEEADMGPRVEGQEREGVDLDRVPKRSERQAWMSMMHESMSGAFGDGDGPGRKDKYEVQRSQEERKKFEEAYAKRGKSLLEEQRENKFVGHEEEHANVRKRKVGPSDIWGMSAKDIESGGVAAAAPKEQRRSFDPEKDMEVAKPVSREQFNSLVENSAGALSGRFSRSQIATSFL